MGKRAKEHRKKVAVRNQQIKGAQKKYQEFMNEKMMDYLKEMKEKGQQEIETPTTQSGFTLV
jgi:hypothetical protein